MQFLLVGLIAGLIGGVPLDFGRDGWMVKWIFLTVLSFIFWSFIGWWTLPQLIGPLWGGGLIAMTWLTLAVNVGWTLLITSRHHSTSVGALVGIVMLLVPLLPAISGWNAFNAQEYRAFVGDDVEQHDWHTDMAPIDTVHIRVVSMKQAEWRADKVLGQADGSLGSRYKVGQMVIQQVGDELMWVGPLEFLRFQTWQGNKTSPGYVMVSAEDPTREPELVTGMELRYLSSAYWGSNLQRYLYVNGYQFKGTTDYTFEIDDDGKPYFVVTEYHPTISWWGAEIDGVVLVDPQTGDITPYTVDEAPLWIDRIMPRGVASTRLTDYGNLVHGWWNSVWNKVDVNIPTQVGVGNHGIGDSKVWMTWGDDGRAYWFTGLSSAASSDQSLVGFVLMDTRTGETFEYRLSGDDENAVLDAVNASVSNFSGWSATQPILYNIYGELTWVSPVISGDGIFQRVAFMHATNSRVALGTNKQEALMQYKRILAESGNGVAPTSFSNLQEVTGEVVRLSSPVLGGNTTYYLVIDGGDSRIFTGSPIVSDELPITTVGDHVRISYIETTESTVPMEQFDLIDFSSRSSYEQGVAAGLHEDREARVDQRHEATDIRAQVGNMSDDELIEQYGDD